MEQYTIFCTPEQTRKALELGAPIKNVHYDNDGGYIYADRPSAEQMISWLEEQGIFINIDLTCNFIYQSYLKTLKDADHNIISNVTHHSSLKEATLAAIDAALNRLTKEKIN